jgi:hypothetical protein
MDKLQKSAADAVLSIREVAIAAERKLRAAMKVLGRKDDRLSWNEPTRGSLSCIPTGGIDQAHIFYFIDDRSLQASVVSKP